MKNNLIQSYLSNQIDQLNGFDQISISKENLAQYIYNCLTTSKYRRHSISSEYQEHIKNVINTSINNSKPIPLVWVFGCYKLWRLKESPYVDWAELFFLIHKTNWLKPILAAYKPGVWFDFFADGIIVSQMNNLPESDQEKYQNSFLDLLCYFKNHVPSNLNFTLHTLESLYGSKSEYKLEFDQNYQKILEQDKITPFVLSDQQKSIIEMNTKSDHQLTADEFHQSQLLFETFGLSSKRRPYYRTPDKIFLDSFPIKNTLPIGSVRTSSVRFWIGKGVLQKYNDTYIENILSISQINNSKFENHQINFDGLDNQNFKSIDVIK